VTTEARRIRALERENRELLPLPPCGDCVAALPPLNRYGDRAEGLRPVADRLDVM
jgi:hypothetical protein